MFQPIGSTMAWSQMWFQACLTSQQKFMEAGLSAADAMGRGHERPEQAADRAQTTAARGETGSWYRRPAANWSEVCHGWMMANPVMQFWQQAFTPQAMMSQWQAAAAAPFSFGVPGGAVATGSQNQGAALAMANPFAAGLPLAAPMAAIAVQPMIGLLHTISGFAAAAGARADLSTQPSDQTTGIGGRRDAVASITLPDQTVYKITIPIADPMPFWPWSGSYSGGGFASEPPIENNVTPMIEGEAVDEQPAEDGQGDDTK